MTTPGRVVILNGASSAGKSTIAERFRAARAAKGDWWLLIAVDDFYSRMPPQWFSGGDHVGPFSHEGIRFEPSPNGLVVRLGDVGRQLFAAYHRTVAVWARAGFNVLVDEVAVDEECVIDWRDALAGLRVTWVAIRCDPDVAEARERARGDRVEGLARGLSAIVHMFAPYDFELDTTESSADRVSAQLASIVAAS
jgi:chloramphenicol 3-O phosphotransferase